jgi:hypothetical protein
LWGKKGFIWYPLDVNSSKLKAASQALTKLIEDAEACARLWLDAGLAVPSEVEDLIGESRSMDGGKKPARGKAIQKVVTEPFRLTAIAPIEKVKYPARNTKSILPVPKPDYGPPPKEAGKDWVAMKTTGASPYALALAILKAQNGPISRPDLSNKVSELRGLKRSNAGYNVLTKMKAVGEADETPEGGWTLRDKTRGGIVVGNILWTPEDELTYADRAEHRREGILLLLELNGPLKGYQISNGLKASPWIRAGKNNNFVKADMNQLENDEKVRRLEDKRWALQEVKK